MNPRNRNLRAFLLGLLLMGATSVFAQDPFTPAPAGPGAYPITILNGVFLDGVELTANDWVAVIDENGVNNSTESGGIYSKVNGEVVCAAAPYVVGSQNPLGAANAEQANSNVPWNHGWEAGNPVVFRIYIDSLDAYFTATGTFSVGNGTFGDGPFAFVDRLDASDDTDSDGLSDSWETTFFGGLGVVSDPAADYDGDDETNGAEAAANTDGADARDTTNPANAFGVNGNEFLFSLARIASQTDLNTVTGARVSFTATGGYTSGSITKPNSAVVALTADAGTVSHSADFADVASLAAAYMDGTYSFELVGATTIRFKLQILAPTGPTDAAFPALESITSPTPGSTDVDDDGSDLDADVDVALGSSDWEIIDIKVAGSSVASSSTGAAVFSASDLAYATEHTIEVTNHDSATNPALLSTFFASITTSTFTTIPEPPCLPVADSGTSHAITITNGTLDGVELAAGDWICVIDEAGQDGTAARAITEVVVAAGPYTPGMTLNAVISTGALVPGAVPGNGITLRVYDASEGVFLTATVDGLSGDATFAAAGSTTVTTLETQSNPDAAVILLVAAPGVPAGIGTDEVTVPDTVSVLETSTQQFSVNASGGAAPYTYAWTVDGAPVVGETNYYMDFAPGYDFVTHPATEATVAIVCTVTDNTGAVFATSTWTGVRVMDVDREPTAPVISFSPAAPMTTEDIIANIATASVDPDGDTILGYDYVWRLEAVREAFTTNTLSSVNTQKGNFWEVTVRPITNPYGIFETIAETAGEYTVQVVNTDPTAVAPPTVAASIDAPITIQLAGTDPDLDDDQNDTLTFVLGAAPANGSLSKFSPSAKTVVYTPVAGYAGTDQFTFLVRDDEGALSTATTVDITVDGWAMPINVTFGSLSTLELGMHSLATDTFDADIDQYSAPVGDDIAQVDLLTGADVLRRDIRAPDSDATWTLVVDANDAVNPVIITWDSATVPLGSNIWLIEVDALGAEVLNGISLDMRETNQLILPIGTDTRFELRYGQIGFDLAINRGWNLISIPIHATDSSIAGVLQGANFGNVFAFNAGAGALEIATSIVPGRGYFVFRAHGDTVIRITGTNAVDDTTITLVDGWNLVGPPASSPYNAVPFADVITNPTAVVQPVYEFTHGNGFWAQGVYDSTQTLTPGKGQWIYADITP